MCGSHADSALVLLQDQIIVVFIEPLKIIFYDLPMST